MRKLVLTLVACLMTASYANADLVGYWPLNDGAGSVAANMVEGGAADLLRRCLVDILLLLCRAQRIS